VERDFADAVGDLLDGATPPREIAQSGEQRRVHGLRSCPVTIMLSPRIRARTSSG